MVLLQSSGVPAGGISFLAKNVEIDASWGMLDTVYTLIPSGRFIVVAVVCHAKYQSVQASLASVNIGTALGGKIDYANAKKIKFSTNYDSASVIVPPQTQDIEDNFYGVDAEFVCEIAGESDGAYIFSIDVLGYVYKPD